MQSLQPTIRSRVDGGVQLSFHAPRPLLAHVTLPPLRHRLADGVPYRRLCVVTQSSILQIEHREFCLKLGSNGRVRHEERVHGSEGSGSFMKIANKFAAFRKLL